MNKVLFNSPHAYCVIDDQDGSFKTFCQGLVIVEKSEGMYAIYFDKIAFQERDIAIDSFQSSGDTISLLINENKLSFLYIDTATYEKIKQNRWLRPDLIKELSTNDEIQKYFTHLSIYS